jgi:hypothetical protein
MFWPTLWLATVENNGVDVRSGVDHDATKGFTSQELGPVSSADAYHLRIQGPRERHIGGGIPDHEEWIAGCMSDHSQRVLSEKDLAFFVRKFGRVTRKIVPRENGTEGVTDTVLLQEHLGHASTDPPAH